jgi:SAM-dependent methyltransferase
VRFLERAVRAGSVPDFLLRHAEREVAERLQITQRNFKTAALISAYDAGLLQSLKDSRPDLSAISLCQTLPLALQCGPRSAVFTDEALPLAWASIDLAVAALSLNFANDLPGVFIQVRRALKPDGLFTGAILGGDTLIELRQVFLDAEQEMTGGASPRVSPTVDVRDLGGLLQRAGFALPVTDSEKVTVSYASLEALMRDLRGMGASNALAARSRTFLPRSLLGRADEIYRERYPLEGGRIAVTFEFLYFSGWAPHESQQKPLAPGSAKTRLADALKQNGKNQSRR